MSIVSSIGDVARRSKRRKLSKPQNVDERFEQHASSEDELDASADDVDDHNVKTQHGPMRRQSTQSLRRRAVPITSLNKSSIQSIQFDELLVESTPKYDHAISKIQPILDDVKQSILSVPETEPLSLEATEGFAAKHGVSIPFPSPRPAKDTNLKFQYDRPASIELLSDFHLHLGIKGTVDVKLVVEMPKHLLQEKDYLNYRAFHKRAFYLACIAAQLQQSGPEKFEQQFSLEDGMDLLPMILLVPRPASKQLKHRKYLGSVLITVAFPKDGFSIDKTLPMKNCVRSKADKETSSPPTPAYNSVLNSQARIISYKNLVQEANSACPGYSDACRAGLLWLAKRKFDGSYETGGFGLWEWATLSALLLKTGGHKGHPLFSQRYSSLQLFKAMLQVLAGRDMTDPWILNVQKLLVPSSDAPVIYDGHTGVNILHKMTPWSYQMLRQYAQVSLATLKSKDEDALELTFENLVSQPHLQFDEIHVVNSLKTAGNVREVLHKLYRVMKRGLGDRIDMIDLQVEPPKSWPVGSAQRSQTETAAVHLRLVLNMNNQSRLVDHGPAAEDQEAAADFQQFWGEKAELRRFKDGSILESLVWSKSTPVTKQIIEYLIERHFKASKDCLSSTFAKLETPLIDTKPPVTVEEAFKLIDTQFQALSSKLHQLQGLPIPIRSISAADPGLRSSTTHHPLSGESLSPMNILIQFDSSTRWPDSLPAIQHTKTAFLLKLSELLSSADSSITTRVGLEDVYSQQSGYQNTSFLDIIYPSAGQHLVPVPFRLRIHHDRELSLLQTELAKSSSLSPAERTRLISSLAAHKRLLALPVQTSAIRTLITRFPPLSTTIRLTKSFFAAHHLTNLIPPELIELLCAHAFLHPAPWSPSGSATTAFLRVQHFLSRWDWSITPLVIDLSVSQDMPVSTREELKTRFAAWRKLDPNMNNVSWFIGTNIDASGVVWVEGGKVEKVVAGRVKALAEAVMQTIVQHENGMMDKDWKSLFVGDTSEYDFVLHLDAKLVPGSESVKTKGLSNGDSKFKNLALAQQGPSTAVEDIGFTPVSQYLADLERAFGHVALFFSGEGQTLICGLWRPSVLGEKEWRVRLGWSSTPVRYNDAVDSQAKGQQNLMCTFNKQGALAEMGLMGAGIVKDIKVKA